MIPGSSLDWFLILITFSALGITAFLIRTYALKYNQIKAQVHAIHALIELIDVSLQDDEVTKEEFTAIIKKCLEILAKLL